MVIVSGRGRVRTTRRTVSGCWRRRLRSAERFASRTTSRVRSAASRSEGRQRITCGDRDAGRQGSGGCTPSRMRGGSAGRLSVAVSGGGLPVRRRWVGVSPRRNRSSSARGYGWTHQLRRKAWRLGVDVGSVACARCGLLIELGQPWGLVSGGREATSAFGDHAQIVSGGTRSGSVGAWGRAAAAGRCWG
jgi:hypothetical protein